jgi:hypothetical protein
MWLKTKQGLLNILLDNIAAFSPLPQEAFDIIEPRLII